MFRTIADEARKMARNPRRLGELLRPRRWGQFLSVLRFERRTGQWQGSGDGAGFRRREYPSYEEYVRHQQSKLKYLDLEKYERAYRRALAGRLREIPGVRAGMSVLCLGARRGAEVEVFRDLGCQAIGIDLMPGPNNPFVIPGDFHNLQFSPESMDIMFTNSLDHAFDLKKVIGEIRRVLKPEGRLIVEAMRGGKEGVTPDHYASFFWEHTEDLIALIVSQGFTERYRASFAEPWPGDQFCLTRDKTQ